MADQDATSLLVWTAVLGLAGCSSEVDTAVIRGRVLDEHGYPLAHARVRIAAQRESTLTDEGGEFAFAAPNRPTDAAKVTAWKEGYYIGHVAPRGRRLRIQLRPLPVEDATGYEWVDPTPGLAAAESCGNCHAEIYDEWSVSGHAHAAGNRRFLNLYNGDDAHGNRGAGWSLREEHPHGIGVCAACHAPGIDFDGGGSDDLATIGGTALLGVHCDYCHKVQAVDSGDVGLAHGRFGVELLRPADGQLVFGPLDDATRGNEAYSPLQQESRYCASCHEGVVFGVHVYSTYSEWQASPAAALGRTCQSCHMAPTGTMTNVAPGFGGIERDPSTLASHQLSPGGRAAMLRSSLEVSCDVMRRSGSVVCRIELRPTHVGHRVPTGFADRHLILVVEPFDAGGARVVALAGPRLPAAAGSDLESLPGRLFAKVLVDEQGQWPVPFWRAAEVFEDSRLFPEQAKHVAFRLPSETRRLRVRVLYRRFWKEVAEEKDWPDDTITVYDQVASVPDGGTER